MSPFSACLTPFLGRKMYLDNGGIPLAARWEADTKLLDSQSISLPGVESATKVRSLADLKYTTTSTDHRSWYTRCIVARRELLRRRGESVSCVCEVSYFRLLFGT